MMSIEGKTAFVSGAGRNIGRAIALEFARRGCTVVVNGLSNRDACEETAEAVRDWHPQESVCWPSASIEWGLRVLQEKYKGKQPGPDALHPLDGVSVWASDVDLAGVEGDEFSEFLMSPQAVQGEEPEAAD